MLTLIKNGLIIDGKGNDAFPGNILLQGDKIIDVTSQVVDESSVEKIIDAEGNLVAPGFIDVHSHSDAYLIIEPSAPSKISQGITTEINGQCGGSIAPRFGEARLSSDWAKLLGERLTWNSLLQYR
jgi:N-acyl-D-amino-acid deacylase